MADPQASDGCGAQRVCALRTAFEHFPFEFWIVDVDGRFTAQNPVSLARWGDLSGKRITEAGLPAEIQAQRIAHVERALAGEVVQDDVEFLMDGEQRFFLSIYVPIRHGQWALGVMGADFDVSELRRKERALSESEKRFALVLRGADLGFWDWNVQTGENTFNVRWAEMLGYTLEEARQHRNLWSESIHPEDRARVMRALDAHLAGESEFYESEHRVKTKSGAWRWILDRGKLLERDGEGKPLRAAGTHLDITARKNAELERERFKGFLYKAQKMEAVGQLAAGIAHDINNTLTVVAAHCDALVADDPLGQTQRESAIARIRESLEQARGITRALLTFGGRISTKKKPVDLCAVVEEACALLWHTLPADVVVDVNIPSEPRPWIDADANQLRQIVLNLAANAREAMQGREGGRLRISVIPPNPEPGDADDAPHVRLVFRDEGGGIAPGIRDRVFEPFFTTKDREHSQGLGLTVVHGIVKDHGGAIELDFPASGGTVVTLIFPTVPAEGEARPDVVPDASLDSFGATVLVAEDNDQVRGLITLLLKAAGYKVRQVVDGAAFVEALRSGGLIDMFVVDVELPARDGFECLRIAREKGYHAPVIMIAGGPTSPYEDGLEDNMILLPKPFQMGELLRLVRAQLKAYRLPPCD